MRFFCGLHQPSDAQHFDACFVSVNRLRGRKGPFQVGDWIMDSGAFTEISTYGDYRTTVAEYASEIRRWSKNGHLLAAVAQDWMCEPWIIERTGLSVAEHQRRTVERYDALSAEDTAGVYVMPVLQGYAPADYVRHIESYGERLPVGAWVGVGSICKRNASPRAIEAVLLAIREARPDLRLHGFGLKSTALRSALVFDLLHTADSMAWSYQARMAGRNANDWREAKRWMRGIENVPRQLGLGHCLSLGVRPSTVPLDARPGAAVGLPLSPALLCGSLRSVAAGLSGGLCHVQNGRRLGSAGSGQSDHSGPAGECGLGCGD